MSEALTFFLQAFAVLTAIGLVGGLIGWIAHKLGFRIVEDWEGDDE